MKTGIAIGKLMVLRTLIKAARHGNNDRSVWVACERDNAEAIEMAIEALKEKEEKTDGISEANEGSGDAEEPAERETETASPVSGA